MRIIGLHSFLVTNTGFIKMNRNKRMVWREAENASWFLPWYDHPLNIINELAAEKPEEYESPQESSE